MWSLKVSFSRAIRIFISCEILILLCKNQTRRRSHCFLLTCILHQGRVRSNTYCKWQLWYHQRMYVATGSYGSMWNIPLMYMFPYINPKLLPCDTSVARGMASKRALHTVLVTFDERCMKWAIWLIWRLMNMIVTRSVTNDEWASWMLLIDQCQLNKTTVVFISYMEY